MNQVHIDSATEEAHAILRLRNDKVLVDPHKDHPSHKDPNEEKYDTFSPMIILEEDSKEKEAPNEELISVEPNPEVYKPLGPYPHLVSQPKAPTSKNKDKLLEAFRHITITIPLVNVIHIIPSNAKFLKIRCTHTKKLKRIPLSETISSIM